MPATLAIEQYDASGLDRYRDELLSVYVDVYADKLGNPFFAPDRYWERLVAYGIRDGFSLVLCRLDGALIGYTMGFTLPAGAAWWRGLRTVLDPALLVEDGHRTFALTYMMVLAPCRRRGYAHALHDTLMRARPEARGALLVLPDNLPALAAYRSWGWYRLGELQPFADAPIYDAMILELPS